ncbi:hypothetical protein LCGC14_0504320 [marine sediment metagenome]|uniref:Uncharacterized protein n=1 Tax=marine sediment metagenome TaxID=412755 RepID=A0A0F9SLB1_9ZZZZ
MPVHKIESTGTHVRLWKESVVSGRLEIDVVALLTEQEGNNVKVAALVKMQLQDFLDVRIKRTDLPSDEPTRTSNPNREDFFWDGPDLVSRPVIVSVVVWDGECYAVTLRRAR